MIKVIGMNQRHKDFILMKNIIVFKKKFKRLLENIVAKSSQTVLFSSLIYIHFQYLLLPTFPFILATL